VANAGNIKKVKQIVADKLSADKIVVVVSAFSGVTDQLLQCGQQAVDKDDHYKTTVEQLTQQHLQVVKELLPFTAQSGILSWVVQQFHEIEDLCNGIRLLNELSDRTKDRLVSYGELISSKIIAAYFNSDKVETEWLDARSLIKTDSHFTKATVDFNLTKQNILQEITTGDKKVLVVPGFIASDENRNTTTLGRGGSDYTAAIFGNLR